MLADSVLIIEEDMGIMALIRRQRVGMALIRRSNGGLEMKKGGMGMKRHGRQ